jgi:MYXO-CTERM domain-containing protein
VGRLRGLLVGLAALGLVALAERAAAEQKGIDSTLYYEGTIGCGSPSLGFEQGCHAEFASELVSVSIDGPDSIDPELGGAALFGALAQTEIQGQAGSGINVWIDPAASTSDCRLDPFPTPGANQLTRKGPVLSHQDADAGPPLGSLGVFSYDFLLVDCTTPGTVRLLVAMNTFNYDGDITGDAWNQAEKTITVPEPGAGPGAPSAVAALLAAAARRRRRHA